MSKKDYEGMMMSALVGVWDLHWDRGNIGVVGSSALLEFSDYRVMYINGSRVATHEPPRLQAGLAVASSRKPSDCLFFYVFGYKVSSRSSSGFQYYHGSSTC